MKPRYDFSGKVAFVTGASQGMGVAAAQAFAAAGASVVLADVNSETVEQAAQQIRDVGGTAIGVICDVADDAQVEAAVNKAVETYGSLDFAFNNAGVQVPLSDIADQPLSDYNRVADINLRGVWSSMKYELQQMRKQGSGAIVNNASVGGLVGNRDLAPYNASKHGVIGLTKSAAISYAARGIRVNSICPGTIDTPMVAGMDQDMIAGVMRNQIIERLGQPEEIAQAVLWLCSEGASFVVGGALPVDGGFVTN
ncbi:glucose 1-dehydrogenase [Novosphingobium clariflavum]|uniref:Glucose 1-dehydrogenase n=1 Tax=Novosphingobium clariflavum TaxID=2029884 RepID=A0ABV6S6H9_9SPHN|nr:glucose 1-dehydrogenase [Novosphingobium clariflavum]